MHEEDKLVIAMTLAWSIHPLKDEVDPEYVWVNHVPPCPALDEPISKEEYMDMAEAVLVLIESIQKP